MVYKVIIALIAAVFISAGAFFGTDMQTGGNFRRTSL